MSADGTESQPTSAPPTAPPPVNPLAGAAPPTGAPVQPTAPAAAAGVAASNPYWDGQRYLQWDGQRWLTWNGVAWVDAGAPQTPAIPVAPVAQQPQVAPQPVAPGYAPPVVPAPAYAVPYGAVPRGPQNGLGTAALVLGILAILFALTPITYWVSLVLGPLALIFGLIGRSRANSGDATNKGAAMAGIVMGVVAIIACIFWIFFWIFFINRAVDSAVDTLNSASRALAGIGVVGGATPTQLGQTIPYDDGLTVKLGPPTSFTPSGTSVGSSQGETAFTMTVTVKNGTSTKYEPLLFAIDARAGSPQRPCEQVFDPVGGVGSLNSLTSVPPGQEISASVGFSCAATPGSVLDVEVTPTVLKYQQVTQVGSLP